MKNLKSIIFLTTLTISVSSSLVLQCRTSKQFFNTFVGTRRTCILESDPKIFTPLTAVSDVNHHENSEFHFEEIDAFEADNKTVYFIPRGLDRVFSKDLIAISVTNCQLQEVHREALMDHRKLQSLYLYHNQIQVIERDLFADNPELQIVLLQFNQIKFIHPTAFDNLNNLHSLDLRGNCLSKEIISDAGKVTELLRNELKGACSNGGEFYENYLMRKMCEIKESKDAWEIDICKNLVVSDV